jgi:hypothetical protein
MPCRRFANACMRQRVTLAAKNAQRAQQRPGLGLPDRNDLVVTRRRAHETVGVKRDRANALGVRARRQLQCGSRAARGADTVHNDGIYYTRVRALGSRRSAHFTCEIAPLPLVKDAELVERGECEEARAGRDADGGRHCWVLGGTNRCGSLNAAAGSPRTTAESGAGCAFEFVQLLAASGLL